MNPKPAVLFVASYSPYAVGGVGQFMIDLGTRLLQDGVRVGMCYRTEPEEFELPPRIAPAERTEVPVSRVRGWRTLGFLVRTGLALVGTRSRFDVCHLIVPQPMTAVAAFVSKVLGRPVAATVFAPYPKRGKWGADTMQAVAERFVLRMADAVIFECEATRRRFAPQPGEVILNGIDVEYYRPDPARRSQFRKNLAIPSDAVVFLYVGRMAQSKGIHDLLAAFASLDEGLQSRSVLLLVGPLETSSDDLIRVNSGKRDRIRFVGPVGKDAVLDYYLASDAFVLPSYQEGISSSLVEAMACGLPAVASSAGGNVEVVVDGENGFLHAPGDIRALTKSFETLISQRGVREDMGRRARERVRERFNIESMARQYTEVYQAIAGTRSVTRP